MNQQKSGGVSIAAALLICQCTTSLAGVIVADSKKAPEPVKVSNPLCFLDGTVCFDVQERFRWEIRDNNADFDDSINSLTDDNWFLQRLRIGLKLKPADWVTIYVQGQDAREIDSDRADIPGLLGAEGDDTVDLRQGWVEFGHIADSPLTLKLGRQILAYGDERLVGLGDWNNIGRTFDAATLHWEQKSWWLDAFAGSVVIPNRGQYNQSDFFNGTEFDRQQIFTGLYFSTIAIPVQTTDAYAFYLHENDNPSFAQNTLGDSNFLTLGLRVKSNPGAFSRPVPEANRHPDGKTELPKPRNPIGFDYDSELVFQTGNVRGLDLTAFAAHVGTGYTFDSSWRPRLGINYNFASGDNDPTDQDIETFQNLFPSNHKLYGQMDEFSWQNMHDLEFNVAIKPYATLAVGVQYHAFWLATTEDAWYRSNGVTVVRPLNATSMSAGSFAGQELDLIVTWNAARYLQIQGGYSRFFAGSYLAETGPASDANFGYVQVTLNF